MLAMLAAPGGLAMMGLVCGLTLADRITEGRHALLVAGQLLPVDDNGRFFHVPGVPDRI